MKSQTEDSVATLRRIEDEAAALARGLPPGVPAHRARLIEGIAAHLALTLELTHEARPREGGGRVSSRER